MARYGKKSDIVAGSPRAFPDNLAVVGADAKQFAQPVMGKSVKPVVVDDCGAHVEGGSGLMPFFGHHPFVIFEMRMDAADAASFSADENMSFVDRWRGHVLVRPAVR